MGIIGKTITTGMGLQHIRKAYCWPGANYAEASRQAFDFRKTADEYTARMFGLMDKTRWFFTVNY